MLTPKETEWLSKRLDAMERRLVERFDGWFERIALQVDTVEKIAMDMVQENFEESLKKSLLEEYAKKVNEVLKKVKERHREQK